MALKQVVLAKKIEEARRALDVHRSKNNFEQRKTDLDKREQELEAAVSEITEDTSDEDRAAVDAAVAEHEAAGAALETDQAEHSAEEARLQAEVDRLEAELEEINARSAAAAAAPASTSGTAPAEERRKDIASMAIHNYRDALGMTAEQRTALNCSEEVRSFITKLRSPEARSVSGAALTIPTVMLEVVRDNITQYAPLMEFVDVRRISGDARVTIVGTVPEAVWMEATGLFNELDLTFNQITIDGYKVGGFVPIPRVYIEDSSIDLAGIVVDSLGKGIGKSLTRAILFGNGTNMPVGIITRLAQTSQPSNWGSNNRTWTDLHTSNVKKINIDGSSGAAFFADLNAQLAIAKSEYSDGRVGWIMNHKTYLRIMGKAAGFNSQAALLSQVSHEMPIIGGRIYETELMADNEIVGGYGSLYLLAERAGGEIRSSEHVRFLQDQIVFLGTARYDGQPLIGEAFVTVSFDNTDATTSSTFPVDYANTALGVLGVVAAAGTDVGDTMLTVSGTAASGTTLKYIIGAPEVYAGFVPGSAWKALTSGTTQITCAAGKTITVVELDGNGHSIKAGTAKAVPKT